MSNRLDATNCTHEAALARIAELESKLQASVNAHNEIFDALRASEEKLNAQSLRLSSCLGLLREVADSGVVLADQRISYVEVQLDADLVERIQAMIVEKHRHLYGDDGRCSCGIHALD